MSSQEPICCIGIFSICSDMNMPPYTNQSYVKSNQGTSIPYVLELQSIWSRY